VLGFSLGFGVVLTLYDTTQTGDTNSELELQFRRAFSIVVLAVGIATSGKG